MRTNGPPEPGLVSPSLSSRELRAQDELRGVKVKGSALPEANTSAQPTDGFAVPLNVAGCQEDELEGRIHLGVSTDVGVLCSGTIALEKRWVTTRKMDGVSS